MFFAAFLFVVWDVSDSAFCDVDNISTAIYVTPFSIFSQLWTEDG